MKKQRKLLLPLLAALFFAACGPKTLVDQQHDFPNNTWPRFDAPAKFSFDCTNVESFFNITISAVVDTARYRQNGLPLTLQLQSPNGEQRTLFCDIVLRNYQGTWLGEFDENGLLHVSQAVRQYYSFNNAGKYHLDISQRTNKHPILGIHSIHLNIQEAQMKYPE